MSFCAIGNRNQGHIASRNYLFHTAQRLKSNLQCWIANILGHGWFFTNTVFDSAQTGGLLYPLAHIRVDPEGYYTVLTSSIFNRI